MRQGKELSQIARGGDQGMKLAHWEMEYSSFMEPDLIAQLQRQGKATEDKANTTEQGSAMVRRKKY